MSFLNVSDTLPKSFRNSPKGACKPLLVSPVAPRQRTGNVHSLRFRMRPEIVDKMRWTSLDYVTLDFDPEACQLRLRKTAGKHDGGWKLTAPSKGIAHCLMVKVPIGDGFPYPEKAFEPEFECHSDGIYIAVPEDMPLHGITNTVQDDMLDNSDYVRALAGDVLRGLTTLNHVPVYLRTQVMTEVDKHEQSR